MTASVRRQRCNGRTSGDSRTLCRSSDCCSPRLLPTAHPKEPPQHLQELLLPGVIYLYRNRLPLKNKLLLDTVRTWLDFSNLQQHQELREHPASPARR